jgi:uncharacterized protein (TIGR00266 family)
MAAVDVGVEVSTGVPAGGAMEMKYQPVPTSAAAGGAAPAYTPPVFAEQPPLEGPSGVVRTLDGYIRDRPAFSHVEVRLQPGQKVKANAKAMIWMDGLVKVKTRCNDCCDGCWRTCAGESCCVNEYTGHAGGGAVTFALDLPGDMLPFAVAPGEGNGWVVAAGSYVCGTDNLRVSARWAGCKACCCGDVRPWLCKVTIEDEKKEGKSGMFWAGGYGALTRHEVQAGQVFYLDNGLFFAANEKVNFELALPGGCVSCCWGMEGVVMQFRGPCVVYSQNRSPHIWQKVLNPPPPKKKKQKGGAASS